jgi:magnesium chelatase accessory protein
MHVSVRGVGPAVLLLHGIPTSGRLWDEVVPCLRPDFTCVVVDLPGAGESLPLADGSLDPERYADELDLLRQRLGILRWHIIGHDAGSTIAVHYAARFGQHLVKLVLCSPPVFPDFKPPWFVRLLRAPVLGKCLAPAETPLLWRVGLAWATGRGDPAIAQIARAFGAPFTGLRGSKRFVQLLRWGELAQALGRTAALLSGITAPTLILNGQDDRAIPVSFAHRAARLIPNAKLRLLDCAHFLPLSCPDALCNAARQFLDERLAVPSGGEQLA